MKKTYNIISKHLNDRITVRELSERSTHFPHPVNEIWGPNAKKGDMYYRVIGTLRDRRDYGEYCSDFIEENTIELYLNGIELGKLGEELKKRNPIEFGSIKCKIENNQNNTQKSIIKKVLAKVNNERNKYKKTE
jgi:hypothetical protein